MKILVAIIAFNEQENIGGVIDKLRDYCPKYDIVVIDNGSTDSTVDIVKLKGVLCIAHAVNSGSPYGTVSSYMMYAKHKNYDVVCQFDGDGQHIASELDKLIEPIMNHNVDYVIGSRFKSKIAGYQSTWLRRLGIAYLSKLVSVISNCEITDITSGFKAYNRAAIDLFSIKHRKEIYDGIQMILFSSKSGLSIVEVPVKMKAREYGVSEFSSMYRSIAFMIKGTLSILAYALTMVPYYRGHKL